MPAQINAEQPIQDADVIVQTTSAQIQAEQPIQEADVIVQTTSAQIVQTMTGQMPKILEMTTFSNHIEILCRCRSSEERMFYILYANKEHLSNRELQRCISNQTYTTLLSSKNSMSKGMLAAYPNAPVMFKDTLFLDFLNLPKKYSSTPKILSSILVMPMAFVTKTQNICDSIVVFADYVQSYC